MVGWIRVGRIVVVFEILGIIGDFCWGSGYICKSDWACYVGIISGSKIGFNFWEEFYNNIGGVFVL